MESLGLPVACLEGFSFSKNLLMIPSLGLIKSMAPLFYPLPLRFVCFAYWKVSPLVNPYRPGQVGVLMPIGNLLHRNETLDVPSFQGCLRLAL